MGLREQQNLLTFDEFAEWLKKSSLFGKIKLGE
jgi:hypothetical protein